jgi:beta-glucosidase
MRKYVLPAAILLLAVISSRAQSAPPAITELMRRVDGILGKMTLEQKIDYIGGTGFAVRALPTLGLPPLEMSDGPYGVRSNTKFPSTIYVAGIGLGASWDRDLAERVGEGIGKDARARGIHFMLGPGVNIYRSPRNGRNFEYFGEDPCLASAVAVGYIQGMQKVGVSATVKHFLGNNSDFDRHDSDSIIDERTLREIYLPTFEAAVKQGHVGAIMDSYNLVNGKHATQNGYFNTEIARQEWGFGGVMMSDWVATYDAVAAANGGLDLEMPTGRFMNRKNLIPAIHDGQVTEATIDEKVRRILLTAARFGWLDRDQADLNLSKYSEANHQLALDAARESMVLLKNDGALLPLDKSKIKRVLVVGPDAYPLQFVGGGSARGTPFAPVSVVEGISSYVGAGGTVYYDRGLPTVADLADATDFVTSPQGGEAGLKLEVFSNADLSGAPASTQTVRHINDPGTSWGELNLTADTLDALFSGSRKSVSRRWTGYFVASQGGRYGVVLQGSGEGSGYRLYIDDKLALDDWKPTKVFEDQTILELAVGPHKVVAEDFVTSPVGGRLRVVIADPRNLVTDAAKSLAAAADVVVVAAGYNNDNESEGSDRTFKLPFGQDELIRELSLQNKNLIVALTAGGNVDSNAWLDHVPAFIAMWYPGEQGGTALAEILFGAVDPSGRLPVTFERHQEDNPAFANYDEQPGSKRILYKEGIFVGYRGYEHNHTKPLFPFGYGLSYTAFKYSNLAVAPTAAASASNGGAVVYDVSFDLTNVGTRAGADVAQVYVGESNPRLPRPLKELKAFVRVDLAPGETKHISVPLDARAFAYYDVSGAHWRADAGAYVIEVGRSSEDITLRSTVNLSKGIEIGDFREPKP